ncbi:TTC31 protein, partial [Baryphthengus martii]|nr:TTC31 protein [Baryphthengus martii]
RELVAEEERMKRKAEKKKLKKKKQKDRKKQEKLGQEEKNKQEAESVGDCASPRVPRGSFQGAHGSLEVGGCGEEVGRAPCLRHHLNPALSFQSNPTAGTGHPQTTGAEEGELDLSCTFVSKARQKAGVKLPVASKEQPRRMGNTELGRRTPGRGEVALCCACSQVTAELVSHPTGRGNEAAQQGLYGEAVQAFTRALQLNPYEHRLFGNRSFCLERLGRCQEALRDAQESLRLRPGWPKGLFRKGKALRGLQRYAEAAGAFKELLQWDRANAEAAAQLQACQALLPVSVLQSSPSIPRSGVPAAPSPASLAPWAGAGASRHCQDNDTSGFVTIVGSRSRARGQAWPTPSTPPTLLPTHPARDCYPLWVGNVTPQISEKVLQGAFRRFGEIRFIRLLPGRRCAFVNYEQKKAAEAAYAAMQDAQLEGSRLLLQLKHPSHATPSPLQHS